ncbi:MAG: tetratricopeptide repeat protein [Treponema sp.]|nr:tetratricopeptide repeat protein [Treponema sp.]
MADKKINKANADEKVSGYVMRHRMPLIILTAVVVAGIVFYSVFTVITSKSNEKGIARIDTIEYELTKDSSGLQETELETRRAGAMTKITPYLKKGGIVGVRANMLAADIAYERKNYADAKTYWAAAALKEKKAYTAPLAYYNEAVCCEEANDLPNAVLLYGKAADTDEFLLAAHARFSQGRVYESQGDYKKAADAYNKVNDKSPDDSWAHLAKTRLISLKADGKIE